ncbi:MAG: carboxyl-terminal processing protease [Cognaticolwellia sp.]|jgi:carboxyl-terminal processing protease
MTFRKFLLIPIIGLIVLASAALPDYLNDTNPEREGLILRKVIEGLGELHYEPQKVNDEFSKRVYELYMNKLDNGKRFLTQSDIKKLGKYELELDNQAKVGSFEFLNLSIDLFEKRKSQIQEYYKDILSEPFDFTKDEELEMDTKKLEYPKNDKALKELWRKSLKYQTLTNLSNLLDDAEIADNGKSSAPTAYKELEKEAREKVLKIHNDWFKRMVKIDREDRFSMYLNSVTGAYDPHTNYFPPQEKENFDISMSGRLEGIGARLQEDGKYVKVVSIVAGSPCWKQGDLEVGDRISAVAQGKEEAVNSTDMPLADVVSMIRGEKGSEVRLTVKKRDNSSEIIPIIRDIVVMEESYAKSAILEQGKKKIGFIHLPKFYTDFQRNGGRRCATDVKDELTKLMKESVDGVILDLRSNGGGSLSDVVEMGGLFVDEGPMVQVKHGSGKIRVLDDDAPGIHYNGALIVMVNTFSASASEILAAALQDYGRAIIVGSSSTFGKGTVQQFIDLDRMVRSSEVAKYGSLGAVKLTTQKFYRVNGGTTQLQGVIPDIIIPDGYTYLEVGEKEEYFALGWDEIPAAKYDKERLKKLNVLKLASAKRVMNDATLSAIDNSAKRFKQRRDETIYSLNLDTYRSEAKKIETESKKLEQLETKIEGLTIVAPEADMKSIKTDESKKARIEEWHKALQKDAQLKETLAIMNDML